MRGGRIHKSKQTFKIKRKGDIDVPEKKKKEHEPEQTKAQASETAPEQKEDGKQASASEELSAEQLQQQIEELNKKLQEQEEQLKEQSDRLLRTLAEYDNYRKRSIKEKDAIYPQAKADTVEKFLPIIDNFERAMQAECADEAFNKGMEMIFQSFMKTMTDLSVEEIGKVGEQFNPDLHNAVMHIEDESLGENVVAQVLQKGYRIGERVVRYAMVQVAN